MTSTAIITRGEQNFIVSIPENIQALIEEVQQLPGCRYLNRVRGRRHKQFIVPLEHEERLYQIVRLYCAIEGDQQTGNTQGTHAPPTGTASITRGRYFLVDIPDTPALREQLRSLSGYVFVGSRVEGRTRYSIPVQHEERLYQAVRRYCKIEGEEGGGDGA